MLGCHARVQWSVSSGACVGIHVCSVCAWSIRVCAWRRCSGISNASYMLWHLECLLQCLITVSLSVSVCLCLSLSVSGHVLWPVCHFTCARVPACTWRSAGVIGQRGRRQRRDQSPVYALAHCCSSWQHPGDFPSFQSSAAVSPSHPPPSLSFSLSGWFIGCRTPSVEHPPGLMSLSNVMCVSLVPATKLLSYWNA